MARKGLWAASAIGAAAAGAAIALVRRRRGDDDESRQLVDRFGVSEPDDGPPAAAPADDPQRALDAARERLRARADALRDQIRREGEGQGSPPAG